MFDDDTIDDKTLSRWMKAALSAAVQGVARGQFPFGAAIYHQNGKQLALEYNQSSQLLFPAAHAEVMAIQSACRVTKSLSLDDCWLVATGEPCTMCASAAAIAGIGKIAFGAPRSIVEQAGYQAVMLDCAELLSMSKLKIIVRGSILLAECTALLMNHPAI